MQSRVARPSSIRSFRAPSAPVAARRSFVVRAEVFSQRHLCWLVITRYLKFCVSQSRSSIIAIDFVRSLLGTIAAGSVQFNSSLWCLQDLGDKAKDAYKDAKSAVKDAAGSVKDGAKDAKDAVKGGAKDA